LNWSKNDSEERDAPWQIVLGSMDTVFCTNASFVTLCWMEVNLRTNSNALLSPYLFSFCDEMELNEIVSAEDNFGVVAWLQFA
jgi:hypothetical protein